MQSAGKEKHSNRPKHPQSILGRQARTLSMPAVQAVTGDILSSHQGRGLLYFRVTIKTMRPSTVPLYWDFWGKAGWHTSNPAPSVTGGGNCHAATCFLSQ